LQKGLIARIRAQNLTLKKYQFDNILIYSNFGIDSILFDHCCNPKFGDKIMAIKEGNKILIHHKMCEKGYKDIKNGINMVFCEWAKEQLFKYFMVISIPSTRGELSKVLNYLFKIEANILSIEYGKDKYAQTQYCSIEFEIDNDNKDKVKSLIEKNIKLMEFYEASDAYK
jgi:GTP pyrophosphokinase